MNKVQFTTQKAIRLQFWNDHPQYKDEYKVSYTQNQYRTDIRCSFCDFVQQLEGMQLITTAMAYKVTL